MTEKLLIILTNAFIISLIIAGGLYYFKLLSLAILLVYACMGISFVGYEWSKLDLHNDEVVNNG